MDLSNNIMKGLNQGNTLGEPKVYLYALLAIFIALYGPNLNPTIPKEIRQIIDNNVFRFLIILTIIYTTDKDISIALIIALAFLIIMSLSNAQDVKEDIKENIKEKFSDFKSIREFYEEEFENKQPSSYPPPNEKKNPKSACSNMKDEKVETFLGNNSDNSGFWNKLEHFQHEVDEDYKNKREHFINSDIMPDYDMDDFKNNVESYKDDEIIGEEVDDEVINENVNEDNDEIDEEDNGDSSNLSAAELINKGDLDDDGKLDENELKKAGIESFTQYTNPELQLSSYENQLRQTMNMYSFNN